MAGFSVNKKSIHEGNKATGFLRAGAKGKRHRFDLGQGAAAPPPLQDMGMGDGDGFGGLQTQDLTDNDFDTEGVGDQDVNSVQDGALSHAAPVAVHIHLGPSDHKAFAGMAKKSKGKHNAKPRAKAV